MSNKLTLSASDRISSLLDEASFVEVGAYVTARNTDFNMQENDTPKDGVITDNLPYFLGLSLFNRFTVCIGNT